MEFGINNYSLRPFYSGKNLSFLKKFVFLRKQDIIEAKPTQQDIFTRMRINLNDFGKLILLNNGDIHTNINLKKMGNLYKDSLSDIIKKAILSGEGWRATRDKVVPCMHCTYEFLCPSISNYEYVLDRNNLCHIYKGN